MNSRQNSPASPDESGMPAESAENPEPVEHEALFYEKLPDHVVRCQLCPHYCRIADGGHGICMGRVNHGGRLIASTYGRLTAIALDPIEKKPLIRFNPGTWILSVSSYGCNLRCSFCQNWHLSQQEAPWRQVSPAELVDLALQEVPQGNIGLAFTYNEPLVTYEYVLDTSKIAHAAGLKTVLVTNGFINPEPMRQLLPWIDAMNIDLKAFQPEFYHKVCKGEIEAVKSTIALCVPACHVEITTLLIPGLNDAEADITALAAWLAKLSPDVTLHLTRHHPDYQLLDIPPISVPRLQNLARLARQHLNHVHLGNI
jgi:pyruvate formate lyase activating enzyme